jgi:hypothetical protein
MSTPETLAGHSVDWQEVHEQYKPWIKDTSDFLERCKTHAEPYMDRVSADPDFEALFTGIAPEVAISILTASSQVAQNILYIAQQQDPFVLDSIVRNETACIITGKSTSYLAEDTESELALPEPSDKLLTSLGKVLLLNRGLGAQAWHDPEVIRTIAGHSMPELLEAIGHDWAIIEWPNKEALVDDLLDNPDLASKLYQTILEPALPLNVQGSNLLLGYFEANREAMREKLFSRPDSKDPTFRLLESLVGRKFIGPELYKATHAKLEAGEATESVATRLRQQVKAMGSLLVTPEFLDAQVDYDNESNELLRSILRWQKFQWGEGSLEGLLDTIDSLRELPAETLCSRYEPSGFTDVERLGNRQQAFTDDMQARLRMLHATHQDAEVTRQNKMSGNPEESGRSANTINKSLDDLLASVRLQHATADSKTQEKIAFQMDRLQEARDYDYTDFPRGIATLARYKQHIQKELMTLLLSGVRYPINRYHVAYEEKDIASLAEIVEIIQHEGVSTILEKHPDLDKQDVRAIKDLLSTRAFEPLFKEASSDKPPVKLNFLPARGLLLEASGHIGYTCWAEKYNITRDRENIDALIFVEQSDSDNGQELVENFAGACVLIRTTAENGQPLLVIRGLNPSLTLLDKVKVTDFYDKLTAYVQSIAEKDGRQAAIVVGDRAGSSGTNRPAIFNILANNKPHLKKVTVPREETFFNSYYIDNNTYLLPSSDNKQP